MNLVEKMQSVFHLAPCFWADAIQWTLGTVVLDTVKFEKFLLPHDNESVADCVLRKYGRAALLLCEEALKGERR